MTTVLTPGADRFQPKALFKVNAFSVVTHLVELTTDRAYVGRCLLQPSGDSEATLLEGIARESDQLKTLQHPNLVSFDRVVEGAGGTWMLFGYEPGTLLSQYSGSELEVPTSWILWWLRQLLLALQALHQHQPPLYIGHLEPADVLVRDDRLFLLDMGIFERIFPERSALSRHRFENFIAPERRQSTQSSELTDLYSAGAIAFWLLTARAPAINAPTAAADMRGALEDIRPTLPAGVTAVIADMLEFYPSHRPPTANAVLQRLSPFITSMVRQTPPLPGRDSDHKFAADPTRMTAVPPPIVASPRPPVPSVVQRTPVRWPAYALAAVLVVAGLALLASLRWRHPAPPMEQVSGHGTSAGATISTGLGDPVRYDCGTATLTFAPLSTFIPPQWDGRQYFVGLLKGSLTVETDREPIEVHLPSDNVLHVPPSGRCQVDLGAFSVKCLAGSATVRFGHGQHELHTGDTASLVGGSSR